MSLQRQIGTQMCQKPSEHSDDPDFISAFGGASTAPSIYDARARMWEVDPHSTTPGRTWHSLEEQMHNIQLATEAHMATDASSTAVEIDTEYSYEARLVAWQASETDRYWSHPIHTPYSYEARQFTWTFRCPTDGCGWQEASDTRISYCRRCYFGLTVVQPKKYPTFLDTVCQVCFDNQEEDWFYFCHTCQACTWRRRCCGAECVDVHALKRTTSPPQ